MKPRICPLIKKPCIAMKCICYGKLDDEVLLDTDTTRMPLWNAWRYIGTRHSRTVVGCQKFNFVFERGEWVKG